MSMFAVFVYFLLVELLSYFVARFLQILPEILFRETLGRSAVAR